MNLNFQERLTLARKQILADAKAGHIPRDIEGFYQLHDHVDANGYGWTPEEWADENAPLVSDMPDAEAEAFTNFWNRIQDALNSWILAGELKHGEE
jgi:hypothetical protein